MAVSLACGVVVVALAALASADANAARDVTFTVLKDTDTLLPHGDHAICAVTKVCAHCSTSCSTSTTPQPGSFVLLCPHRSRRCVAFAAACHRTCQARRVT